MASIYGELQTAENKDISNGKPAQSLTSRLTGEHAPGDSITIDMDYKFNVPNWGINDFLNERSMFQKGISTLAGEPGHFYFKIFFNFDTSFGLLGSLLHVDNYCNNSCHYRPFFLRIIHNHFLSYFTNLYIMSK